MVSLVKKVVTTRVRSAGAGVVLGSLSLASSTRYFAVFVMNLEFLLTRLSCWEVTGADCIARNWWSEAKRIGAISRMVDVSRRFGMLVRDRIETSCVT